MKSSLFLIEQLIAVLIFAIFAAVCVWIFAASYEMSSDASDMNNALIISKNAAECYKAASGDAVKSAQILGGISTGGAVYAYYDDNRRLCEEEEAVYVLSVIGQTRADAPKALIFGDISVHRGGKEVVAFSVAARREH